MFSLSKRTGGSLSKFFMCMHSFHEFCLPDNETDCPICASENKRVKEVKKSLEGGVGAHDSFFKRLESRTDGFEVIAQYFGRGLFSPNLTNEK